MSAMCARAIVAALAAVATLAAPRAQTLRSGFDVAEFDRSVPPQDDLYRHVNAGWLARTAMPSDRVTYGAFAELTEKTERDLQAIIEEISARPDRPRGSTAQQVADLYASTVNVARIEELGASAIEPVMRRIDAAKNARDIAAEAGYLSSIAAGGPFGGAVGIDPLNPGLPVARVTQGGILLPDREYYLGAAPAMQQIRKQYADYLARIFALAA